MSKNISKIVVLDADTLGADLDLSPLFSCGEVEVYGTTPPELVSVRLAGADAVLINKVKLNASNLGSCESLKLICIAATGYDNIDVAYCRERGIAVCNVVGYSTHSVAQLTLSMALSLATHLPEYNAAVSDGSYTEGGVANRLTPVYHELYGKKWGIVGYGNIGKQVGRVAEAMGCELLAFKRASVDNVRCVDLDTLCREADIISVHLPLSDATRGIIGEREIAMMKKDAIVINVARGAVVDEAALADAVEQGRIGGIGIDVYSAEPMPKEHPFYRLKELPNVCLTPHMAWGAAEARARCLDEIVKNINAFVAGERRSRVD